MPAINPDLSRPVLYTDPETGEEIKGGEDSPQANAMREQLEKKRLERLRARNNPEAQSDAPSPAAKWGEDEVARRCTLGPADAPGAVASANSDLHKINTAQAE